MVVGRKLDKSQMKICGRTFVIYGWMSDAMAGHAMDDEAEVDDYSG
jgi:hypothetical protein